MLAGASSPHSHTASHSSTAHCTRTCGRGVDADGGVQLLLGDAGLQRHRKALRARRGKAELAATGTRSHTALLSMMPLPPRITRTCIISGADGSTMWRPTTLLLSASTSTFTWVHVYRFVCRAEGAGGKQRLAAWTVAVLQASMR